MSPGPSHSNPWRTPHPVARDGIEDASGLALRAGADTASLRPAQPATRVYAEDCRGREQDRAERGITGKRGARRKHQSQRTACASAHGAALPAHLLAARIGELDGHLRRRGVR